MMYQLINDILIKFIKCFKNIKTWKWFVTLVIGFMVRRNTRGITQIISCLRLKPELYHTMLNFFRSEGYTTAELYKTWIKTAETESGLVRISGRVLLLGDHIKIPKEGRRMPGVQVHHQESENAGKGEFIEGHIFGHISAVATNGSVSRSLPLMTERQEAPPRLEGQKKPDGETLVVQMANLCVKTAESLSDGKAVIALDAYFAKASFFNTLAMALTGTGEKSLEAVTRAPSDTVAFTVPEAPAKRKRGQPRKVGEKIKLYSIFSEMAGFTETEMVLYGKVAEVRYLCLDLIWKPTKGLIRFVLVELNGSERCVLMSTSLELSPEEIITAYGLRFKIECSFNEQKNEMGCYFYHFWTTALPKRKRWKKTGQPLSGSDGSQLRVEAAKRAIESYVCLCTIATGILTVVAFTHNREIWKRYPGWIKTIRNPVPSIAVVKETIAYEFPVFMHFYHNLHMCSVIKEKQRDVDFVFEDIDFVFEEGA